MWKIDVYYDESFNKALSIKKLDWMFVLAMINLEVRTFKNLLVEKNNKIQENEQCIWLCH